MADICSPCTEFRAGARENVRRFGHVIHICDRYPPSVNPLSTGACPCGCAEREPGQLLTDKLIHGNAFLGPNGERLDPTAVKQVPDPPADPRGPWPHPGDPLGLGQHRQQETPEGTRTSTHVPKDQIIDNSTPGWEGIFADPSMFVGLPITAGGKTVGEVTDATLESGLPHSMPAPGSRPTCVCGWPDGTCAGSTVCLKAALRDVNTIRDQARQPTGIRPRDHLGNGIDITCDCPCHKTIEQGGRHGDCVHCRIIGGPDPDDDPVGPLEGSLPPDARARMDAAMAKLLTMDEEEQARALHAITGDAQDRERMLRAAYPELARCIDRGTHSTDRSDPCHECGFPRELADVEEDSTPCSYCTARRTAGWACSGCPFRDIDSDVAELPTEPVRLEPEALPEQGVWAGIDAAGVPGATHIALFNRDTGLPLTRAERNPCPDCEPPGSGMQDASDPLDSTAPWWKEPCIECGGTGVKPEAPLPYTGGEGEPHRPEAPQGPQEGPLPPSGPLAHGNGPAADDDRVEAADWLAEPAVLEFSGEVSAYEGDSRTMRSFVTVGGVDVIAQVEDALGSVELAVTLAHGGDERLYRGESEWSAGWSGTDVTPGDPPIITVGDVNLFLELVALDGQVVHLRVEEA